MSDFGIIVGSFMLSVAIIFASKNIDFDVIIKSPEVVVQHEKD